LTRREGEFEGDVRAALLISKTEQPLVFFELTGELGIGGEVGVVGEKTDEGGSIKVF
jgi:hypothetical protein